MFWVNLLKEASQTWHQSASGAETLAGLRDIKVQAQWSVWAGTRPGGLGQWRGENAMGSASVEGVVPSSFSQW